MINPLETIDKAFNKNNQISNSSWKLNYTKQPITKVVITKNNVLELYSSNLLIHSFNLMLNEQPQNIQLQTPTNIVITKNASFPKLYLVANKSYLLNKDPESLSKDAIMSFLINTDPSNNDSSVPAITTTKPSSENDHSSLFHITNPKMSYHTSSIHKNPQQYSSMKQAHSHVVNILKKYNKSYRQPSDDTQYTKMQIENSILATFSNTNNRNYLQLNGLQITNFSINYTGNVFTLYLKIDNINKIYLNFYMHSNCYFYLHQYNPMPLYNITKECNMYKYTTKGKHFNQDTRIIYNYSFNEYPTELFYDPIKSCVYCLSQKSGFNESYILQNSLLILNNITFFEAAFF